MTQWRCGQGSRCQWRPRWSDEDVEDGAIQNVNALQVTGDARKDYDGGDTPSTETPPPRSRCVSEEDGEEGAIQNVYAPQVTGGFGKERNGGDTPGKLPACDFNEGIVHNA